MYSCLYASVYGCIHVCMQVCMSVYIYIFVYLGMYLVLCVDVCIKKRGMMPTSSALDIREGGHSKNHSLKIKDDKWVSKER